MKVGSEQVPLDEVTFTVLDVETTGLTPQLGDRVCEIALLRFRGDEELARFQSLVNPQRPISAGAFAVNGIRDQDVVDAPVFAEIASEVLYLLNDCTLVAHNAPFDLSFLASEFHMCGLFLPVDSIVDTLALARCCYRFPSNSLQAVATHLGIDTVGQHRALADVVATKMVFERFVADLRQEGMTTLAELIAIQGGDVGWHQREEIPLPPQIEEALKGGGNLQLRYLSAAGEETLRLVEPLQVTSYSGYQYLVAFCHLRNEQRTFRLDRIVAMGSGTRET